MQEYTLIVNAAHLSNATWGGGRVLQIETNATS